jgi:glutathione S-transferase
MAELKLHDLELSGNCYKVRLRCALLGLHLDIAGVHGESGRMADGRREPDRARTERRKAPRQIRRPHRCWGGARESQANFRIDGSHLAKSDWLALGRATITDIACMPYVALSHEGGLSLEFYPAIRAWIGRIKALPGFIAMPAI